MYIYTGLSVALKATARKLTNENSVSVNITYKGFFHFCRSTHVIKISVTEVTTSEATIKYGLYVKINL